MPLEIKNSDRLSYALMTENDADLLFELDRNPEVMRYINGGTPSTCLLYTSPSPRDQRGSRMPSSA